MTSRWRSAVLAMVLMPALSTVATAGPAEQCIQRACAPLRQRCAEVVRSEKRDTLDACATHPAKRTCRRNARKAARTAIAACAEARLTCSTCCLYLGYPCLAGICGNDHIDGDEACDGRRHGQCLFGCTDDCACEAPPPSVCGNGIIEGTESCDRRALGTCTSGCHDDCTCVSPFCGDGLLNNDEQCDGTDDSSCPGRCTVECTCAPPPVCNNFIHELGEECDIFPSKACGARCLPDCTCAEPICGDSVRAPGEECDGSDRHACNVWCLPDCTCDPPRCGDGVRDQREECDRSDDDRCPGLCSYTDCECLPEPVCGNGILERFEDCDTDAADGDCTPDRCRPDCSCMVCGDGIRDVPFEGCDIPDDATCPEQCARYSCQCFEPTPDTCEEPRIIDALPATIVANPALATSTGTDPLLSCVGTSVMSRFQHTAWYALTAPATGRVSIDSTDSTFDTVLAIHTGNCGELTTVGCVDDFVGSLTSRIEAPVVEGSTYLIEAAAFDEVGSGNELRLDVAFRPCGDGVLDTGEECEPGLPESCLEGTCAATCQCLAPPSDACVDAPVLTEFPLDLWIDASQATGDAADPAINCGRYPGNRSAWVRFQVPMSGIVTLATNGSDFDTILGVFSGECAALTLTDCDDDSGDGYRSFLTFFASPESTYAALVIPYRTEPAGMLHLTADYIPSTSEAAPASSISRPTLLD